MSISRIGSIAIGIGGLIAGTPASAQTMSATTQADGRCIAALSEMSDQSRGEEKASFESSMLYFIGRIAGRAGNASIGPATGAGAVSVSKANAPTVALRCMTEIEKSTAAM